MPTENNALSLCEKCGGIVAVRDKRNRPLYIYRRRCCVDCGHKFSTQEVIQNDGQGRPVQGTELVVNVIVKHFIVKYYQSLNPKEQIRFMDLLGE